MAKLVDALDLGSSGEICESSSLSGPTIYKKEPERLFLCMFTLFAAKKEQNLNFYKQAETMCIDGNLLIVVISQNLNISIRTLFYCKKKYEWDRKCFEKKQNQEIFNKELLDFTKNSRINFQKI